MKLFAGVLAAGTILAAGLATPSHAGCVTGAVVGGVAGHVVGHGVLGAAAGCAVGHHEAKKKKDAQQAPAVSPAPAP